MKKVLIAIDDGPASEKIASAGYQLGKQLNAEIALISVADTTNLKTEGTVTPGELADIMINDLKKAQQILAEKVFENNKVWRFVERGKPFEVILKVAEEWEADLIILGTHGRGGLTHLLMGSVPEKMIRHSRKPLFIIPVK